MHHGSRTNGIQTRRENRGNIMALRLLREVGLGTGKKMAEKDGDEQMLLQALERLQ